MDNLPGYKRLYYYILNLGALFIFLVNKLRVINAGTGNRFQGRK